MAKRQASDLDMEAQPKLSKEGLRQTAQMLRYLRPYRGEFLLGLLLLIISGGVTLIFPKVTGSLVDAATGAAQATDRNTLALALVGILAVQAVFSYLRIRVFARVSERTLRDIRTDVYAKLINLPIPFFEQRRVGDLTSRITADVGQLQDVLSFTLAEFIRQVTTLLIGITIILITSPRLTLVMLSTFPVLVVGAVVFGRFIRKLSRQVTDELAAANTIAEETLQGIQTVKSFTNEAHETARYGARLQAVTSLALRAAGYRGVFVSFVIFSIFGGIVLVLWYGLGLVSAGEITIGQLVSFIIYTSFIGAAAGGLGDLYSQLQKTAGASQRILEILNEKGELAATRSEASNRSEVRGQRSDTVENRMTQYQVSSDLLPLTSDLTKGGTSISFQSVHFSYPARPDVPVLRGIDFAIAPGQVAALVGQSGAGKSTIAQLLMRFYSPTSGQILLDGAPIDSYPLHDVRSRIGVVPQDVLLFGGTLRENIAYGRPGATELEIMNVARRANALGFIQSFPEGLDTLVGERGVKLSGGQRQRVAIARAMLKDPAILILDEATNALDAESEQLVQEALNELMRGRTTLVIAHRLNTIRRADQILVIAEGRIAERGTHAELLALEGGRYAGLLKLQLETAE